MDDVVKIPVLELQTLEFFPERLDFFIGKLMVNDRAPAWSCPGVTRFS
jgi:hypothetical protein